MYQIFIRNFSSDGTFLSVIPEIPAIRELGTDIIWFAPIHPIGEVSRKGSKGSPYAIRDYRAVNPEYGTLEDFKKVVNEIHASGMKCIIDVVYNHTSPDSILAGTHPEWFYHKADGSFGNRVGDWTDIIDLDYSHRELWDYQIETLRQWAEIVDGFRCDVAPLIPVAFWLEARKAVEEVRPDAIWLSESVEPEFILHMRSRGLTAHSDSEIYRAFDICYDYDVYHAFIDFLSGKGSLQAYAEAINRQEYIYPDNYVKLRFLENHDQPRARFLLPDERSLRNLTAFLFFQKGMTLLYAGQEYALSHLPSLFDPDPVDWNSSEKTDLTDLIRPLAKMKKQPLFADSIYHVSALSEEYLIAEHQSINERMTGVFSITGRKGIVPVPGVKDGIYKNEIDGSKIEVLHGYLMFSGDPVIFRS